MDGPGSGQDIVLFRLHETHRTKSFTQWTIENKEKLLLKDRLSPALAAGII